MRSITYRPLAIDEVPLIGNIDRSESVTGIYQIRDGQLTCTDASQQAAPWSPADIAEHTARLRALLQEGGDAFAAWDTERLVAFASLDTGAVGDDPRVMKLDMLYVNAPDRGRGIGRTLTQQTMEVARARGARALYISATPTRGTVDAYLRLGARVLETPDPTLFEREPEDIHLILDLA